MFIIFLPGARAQGIGQTKKKPQIKTTLVIQTDSAGGAIMPPWEDEDVGELSF